MFLIMLLRWQFLFFLLLFQNSLILKFAVTFLIWLCVCVCCFFLLFTRLCFLFCSQVVDTVPVLLRFCSLGFGHAVLFLLFARSDLLLLFFSCSFVVLFHPPQCSELSVVRHSLISRCTLNGARARWHGRHAESSAGPYDRTRYEVSASSNF